MARVLLGFIVLVSQAHVLAADPRAANLYPAVSKDKTGYISQEGKVAIPFLFEDGGSFSQGLAAVLMDGHWGYINEKAEIVIKPRFQLAGNFSEDRALVQLKGKYGYINQDGKVVIEPRFRMAGAFSEGFAVVENDQGKASLIDKAGNAGPNPDVYPDTFGMNYSGFSEGLIFGYEKDNQLPVYMDTDGKIAIRIETKGSDSFVVQGAPFSEGLAAVRGKGNWGYIDRTGKMVIAPEFVKVTPFQQGFAHVAVAGKKNGVERWRNFIIDKKGKKIKQIPWTIWAKFSEGLVPIGKWDQEKKDTRYGFDKGNRRPKYGYMDTRGEIAIQPQFDNALSFRDGLAQVQIHGKNAYIDKHGRPAWIGEARGNERVTSYSGKSMIEIYREILREELNEANWQLAQCYILKMNREELIEGLQISLDWLFEYSKKNSLKDTERGGNIFFVVAAFFATYSRSFVKEDKPIDPTPFRSMLFERSLDTDFRRILAECYGDDDFYVSSWEQIAKDTEVLNKLVADPTEDEVVRKAASQTCFRLISRLYWILRHETIVADTPMGNEPKKYPDIVAMLAETPCPFTPENKARWELLISCKEKSVAAVLTKYDETKTDKARKTLYGSIQHSLDDHLLRDQELVKRVREIINTEEQAKSKDVKGNP